VAKKTLDTYSVQARLKIEVGVDLRAETFEEALAKAKELEVKDFIDIKGEGMALEHTLRVTPFLFKPAIHCALPSRHFLI